MIKFDNNQLALILAFYYFERDKLNDKKIKAFTDKFIDVFNIDISTQSISYELKKFKKTDPSFNSITNNDEMEYKSLWNYYIVEDRISLLKKIYVDFKNHVNDSQNVVEIDEISYNNILNKNFELLPEEVMIDKPKQKYEKVRASSCGEFRDLNTALRALRRANFLCEYDNSHPLFLRKNVLINYTEGHHLIPLKYQHLFSVNLDVEANIVSLCSNCHNQIHFGKDYDDILRKLYEERKERLEKSGIFITFDDLLKFYD